MKTSLITLIALSAPLVAQEVTPPPPDLAEAETVAPAQEEMTTEGLQQAQQHVRLMQAFLDDVSAVLTSDRTKAEKIDALRQLHPRAEELGKAFAAVGMDNLRRAAMTMGTAEEWEQRTAALDAADRDPQLSAALAEIGALIERTPPAPQTKLEAHEQLADDIISFMKDICDVLESDSATADKIAELESMQMPAVELHRYLRSMGRQMVLASVQERTTPEDKQRMDALRERLKTEPELEAAHKELVEHLLNGPKVQYSPEVMQAAKNLLGLMQEMDALMLAHSSEADKLAAMQALRPRVLAMGKQAQGIGFSRIARAAEAIMLEQGTEPDFPGLEAACENPEIERLLEEYRNIMMNLPEPIAKDAPAVQVATEFLTVVADTLDRIRDPKLDEQDKACAMEEATHRLLGINEWAMVSGRGPVVYTLLEANPRFKELVQQYRSVGELTGEAGRAASSYLMVLGMVTENLQHANATP